MTADEKIARISVKVKRAKKHFDELKTARQRFLSNDPEPYAFVREYNAETGYVEIRMTHVEPIPADNVDSIGLILGDVIHNLRSSLDYLAVELWRNGPAKGVGSYRHVEFPFAGDADEFERTHARKVEGMSDAAKKAICKIEPYQSGKGRYLWMLNKLNNMSKHHDILTGIVSLSQVVTSFNDPPGSPPLPMHTRIFTLGAVNMPGFRKLLKAGDVVVTFEPKRDENVEPTFDVAFGEPEIVKGKTIIETLEYMIQLVERLIVGFKLHLE
jgi:hypothetical protein